MLANIHVTATMYVTFISVAGDSHDIGPKAHSSEYTLTFLFFPLYNWYFHPKSEFNSL